MLFCYFVVGCMHVFVKGETIGDINRIADGIITTSRVYKRSEEPLYGDDSILLSGRLLETKMC